jgi:DNA-binding beta-propeller fold protein YncE
LRRCIGHNCDASAEAAWAVPHGEGWKYAWGVAVDRVTNTIYVANLDDNTVSVIDGSTCTATKASHCLPIATMTNVGPFRYGLPSTGLPVLFT